MGFNLGVDYAIVMKDGLATSVNFDDAESFNFVECSDGYSIIFSSSDFVNISGKVSSSDIAKVVSSRLALLITSYALNFVKSEYQDDVRYAVYFYPGDAKFVAVCVQDFDIKDYIRENFARDSSGDIIQFYRCEYNVKSEISGDDVARILCEEVCNALNTAGVKPMDL